MTLDREDVQAIAEAVARLLAPQLGLRADEPEEPPLPHPLSFEARKREAIERFAANRERRERRQRNKR